MQLFVQLLITLILFQAIPTVAMGNFSVEMQTIQLGRSTELSAISAAKSLIIFSPSGKKNSSYPPLPAIIYDTVHTKNTNIQNDDKFLPKFPAIILVPELGRKSQDYSQIARELASHGYVIIGMDLSHYSYYKIPNQSYAEPSPVPEGELTKASQELDTLIANFTPELLNKLRMTNIVGRIGIRTGATIANSHETTHFLISILDPIGLGLLDNSGIVHNILFFNAPNSPNLKLYAQWMSAMNNQLWLKQVKATPFFKQWALQEFLDYDITLTDENSTAHHEKLDSMLRTIINWIKIQD